MRVVFLLPELDGREGVSAASAVWQRAVRELGVEVNVATIGRDAAALDGADCVIVENGWSSQVPPTARHGLAELLRRRNALLRHHELDELPPDDPAWRHVTINERTRLQLSAHGIRATALYHRFDMDEPPGDRDGTRASLGVAPGERLLLQPTRATPAKNVAGGVLLAAGVEATYWLLGPPERGYEAQLRAILGRSPVRVLQGRPDGVTLADAYAASDAVVLPSTSEGFGNATIESAIHDRPLAVGSFPVSLELRRYGFSWFEARESAPLARYLAEPDPFVGERNRLVARMRFSADELSEVLGPLLTAR